MKYFTRDVFVCIDVDPTSESFNEMNALAARRVAEYKAFLSTAMPMWSPTVKQFVSRSEDLHDVMLHKIVMDWEKATVALHTGAGLIVLSSAQEVQIEGEFDHSGSGGTALLYEEFVFPSNKEHSNTGCFQFNVLCELIEVSIVAKSVVRIARDVHQSG